MRDRTLLATGGAHGFLVHALRCTLTAATAIATATVVVSIVRARPAAAAAIVVALVCAFARARRAVPRPQRAAVPHGDTVLRLYLVDVPAAARVLLESARHLLKPDTRAKLHVCASAADAAVALRDDGAPVGAIPAAAGGRHAGVRWAEVVGEEDSGASAVDAAPATFEEEPAVPESGVS